MHLRLTASAFLLLPPCLPGQSVPLVYHGSGIETGACGTATFRAFDFWIGQWKVSDAATGKGTGHDRVESVLSGCGLLESWTAADGLVGRSLSAFDADTKQWLQYWVDAGNTLLLMFGDADSGAMRLAQFRARQFEGPVLGDRITWTRDTAGVQQRWEVTENAGRDFREVFHGQYRPSTEVPATAATAALCAAPERVRFHYFDQSVGEWTVHVSAPNGVVGPALGALTVSKEAGDCLIQQRFRAAAGDDVHAFQSLGFSSLESATRRWRRIYLDNLGRLVSLEGDLGADGLTLEGEYRSTRLRVTWRWESDSRYTEAWSSSRDAGTTWSSMRTLIMIRRYSGTDRVPAAKESHKISP